MGIVKFYSKRSDLVLHINDQVGEHRRKDIVTALEEKKGVLKARFTENRPHLIHVSYNPEELSFSEILERINAQSVQAQRIG